MINDENLEKLYDGVIDNTVLSTKQLKAYGFNQYDITNMINDSIIERVRRGYYKFMDANKLLHYGVDLIPHDSERAYQCFKRCFEIDPKNMSVCFQLFIRTISHKDYDKAFKLFDILSETDNKYYNIDYDLYLLLLSIITDIPEKYKKYARNINYYDIKIPNSDKRYDDNMAYNQVRFSIAKGKFSLALKQLNLIISKRGSSTLQDAITTHLLSQAIKAEAQSRKTIFDHISKKNYSAIIDFLDDKDKRHKLGSLDTAIYTLTKKCINIIETGKIPTVTVTQASKIRDAIDGNNFKLALKICEDFYKDKDIKEVDKVLYYILKDINNTIDNINKTNNNDSIINIDNNIDNTENINYSLNLDVYSENLAKKKEKRIEEIRKKRIEERRIEKEEKRVKEELTDQALIDKMYEELLVNKGVVLLNPMRQERIDNILEFAERYPNMLAEVISEGDNKRIFLRYKPLITDDIDTSEVIEDSKQSYVEKNYEKCIECNLKLLENFDTPKSIMYFMIGLSYLKLHQKDKAIEYITIANGVSKNNNEEKEYGDLLLSLKGEIEKGDRKKRVKVKESDFDDSIIIDNFDEVNNYICESGLDVETACLNLNMSQNEINLINLIYARMYFILGNNEKGELFLKYVERNKDKSKEVKKLLFEIRKNKKFYKNRNKDNIKHLSYTLKPKK